MKKIGIDPEALGLSVKKLRPNGHYNCFCPFIKHERPSADFDPFKGTLFCYNCKTIKKAEELAFELGGTISWIVIEPPEPDERQDSWKLLNNYPLATSSAYLANRGIYPETILDFEIKESSDGIYIPIYKDNRLAGIQFRKSFPSQFRYIYYGKNVSLFPFDHLQFLEPHDTIILVEGIFGALKGIQNGQKAFATFGTNPNPEIANLLNGFSNILIAYDNDFAGYLGAAKLMHLLPQAKVIVPGLEADEITFKQWQNLKSLYATRNLQEIMSFLSEENQESFKTNLINFVRRKRNYEVS